MNNMQQQPSELIKNTLGLEVLTDTGWSKFDGLLSNGYKETVVVRTQSKKIICTLDHCFYKPNYTTVQARELRPGFKVLVRSTIETIVSVAIEKKIEVYDLFNVEKNHRFYANDILVKNCEFLIFDETLINATTLAELVGVEPLFKTGQIRWYKKPEKNKVYVVALDPSLGTGGDPSAIQVLELPDCRQIAEWQHNKTPIQRQVQMLKDICQYIYDEIENETDIYYSVENNTLGEAALVSIAEIGEENIKGTFLSEPSKIGQARRHRKGFTTTNKTKLTACAKLKNLIETKKLIPSSNNFISELKTFVARGTSYAAKIGETDDLVMAMLLAVRMITTLQRFDSDLDEKIKANTEDDEYMSPMPFIMMRS
jgi:hypothetical protein